MRLVRTHGGGVPDRGGEDDLPTAPVAVVGEQQAERPQSRRTALRQQTLPHGPCDPRARSRRLRPRSAARSSLADSRPRSARPRGTAQRDRAPGSRRRRRRTGSARRGPLVELRHRPDAAGPAEPERVVGKPRDVVAARVLLELERRRTSGASAGATYARTRRPTARGRTLKPDRRPSECGPPRSRSRSASL